MIGYKICKDIDDNDVLVQLEITKDSNIILNITNMKIRSNCVIPTNFFNLSFDHIYCTYNIKPSDIEFCFSYYHKINAFRYQKNILIFVDYFDFDFNKSCSRGIHFFLTVDDVLDSYFDNDYATYIFTD